MGSPEPEYTIPARPQLHRSPESRFNILIIGAGLGGLGAAISILLSGHRVTVLEASRTLTEIGAGIQVLPNSSRVLQSWGLRDALSRHWTLPSRVNFWGWKGEKISAMDFESSAKMHGGMGTGYWDFHRAGLHACLLERARDLGAVVRTGCRVVDLVLPCPGDGVSKPEAVLANGERVEADLIAAADGINSALRSILSGLHPDPPIPTGDLAYRLLLPTDPILEDPDLREMITNPQINYWLGPRAHCVNYVLKGGELLNMILLVPDDIPEGTDKAAGEVEEMKAWFQGWDPRIGKLLNLVGGNGVGSGQEGSVLKWKLQLRYPLPRWSHSSGRFTMLGDAMHATLPYLASGAGMSLEDAEVLGLCLGRISSTSTEELKSALDVYEACRKERTEMVVRRGNTQQYLYHLEDGIEQEERDRRMKEVPTREGEALAWRDPGLAPKLLGYDCEKAVEACWPRDNKAVFVGGGRDMREEKEKEGRIMSRL